MIGAHRRNVRFNIRGGTSAGPCGRGVSHSEQRTQHTAAAPASRPSSLARQHPVPPGRSQPPLTCRAPRREGLAAFLRACGASPERGHNLTKVTEQAGVSTRDLRPCRAAARSAPLLPHPTASRIPRPAQTSSPNSSPRPRRLTPGSKSAPEGHRPPLLGLPPQSAPAQRPRALPHGRLRAAPCAGGPRRHRRHPQLPSGPAAPAPPSSARLPRRADNICSYRSQSEAPPADPRVPIGRAGRGGAGRSRSPAGVGEPRDVRSPGVRSLERTLGIIPVPSWPGTPSARPACSKPHQPGVELCGDPHSQVLWATSRAGHSQ